MPKKIRVLVADDSALMRRTLRRILEEDPDFELLDTARDGKDALDKARELKPDVISLDINMPVMDGLTVLQYIVEEEICPVIMVSSLTQKGALTTFEALELGAFDYVGKPDGTVSANMGVVADELVKKLKYAAGAKSLSNIRRQREARIRQTRETPPPAIRNYSSVVTPAGKFGYKAIAIGISTGDPATIMEVLPLLPKEINAAIFLVQHMPASFIASFAKRLQDACQIKVVEAELGAEIQPGTCYVGKGGFQMIAYEKLLNKVIIRTPSTPQTLFMPSASVMMESILKVYGRDTIGVLMTGIGDDGADQMVEITKAGGHTIAESEETAVVYGMPQEAYKRGGAKELLPSYKIAEAILRKV